MTECNGGRGPVDQLKDRQDVLAAEFEQHRAHLRAVAYRMLGSFSEAEDAVQEGWLRLSRSDADDIVNLAGWLTTVVSRVCLDQLRSRKARREDPLEERVPDPVIAEAGQVDPEQQALLGDAVGLAMLVVLDQLAPAERLAFVLHDLFGVPYAEIAPVVERSIDATKMLASRGRRRIQGARVVPDVDVTRQRAVVDAFQAAARDGDFEALLKVLDPDVVLRNFSADGLQVVRGADTVASGAVTFQQMAMQARPVLVNGVAGVAVEVDGRPWSIAAFTVVDGRVVAMDIISDRERLLAVKRRRA
jgi:RNA polymerase sigma factor (sigma-70 family)